jgi:hypothetical protein
MFETILLSRESGHFGTFQPLPRGAMATVEGVTISHHTEHTGSGVVHVISTFGRDDVANPPVKGGPGEELISVIARAFGPRGADGPTALVSKHQTMKPTLPHSENLGLLTRFSETIRAHFFRTYQKSGIGWNCTTLLPGNLFTIRDEFGKSWDYVPRTASFIPA